MVILLNCLCIQTVVCLSVAPSAINWNAMCVSTNLRKRLNGQWRIFSATINTGSTPTMSRFDKSYWDNRYNQEDTTWDLGSVSPPLRTYIDQLPDKNISIL